MSGRPLSEMRTVGPSADSAALLRFFPSAVVTSAPLLGPGHLGEGNGAVPADLRRACRA
jgi:hypothetical protein